MTKRKAANRLESKHIELELSAHNHNHVSSINEPIVDFMYGPPDDVDDGNEVRSPAPPLKPNSNASPAKHHKQRSHTVSFSPSRQQQVRNEGGGVPVVAGYPSSHLLLLPP